MGKLSFENALRLHFDAIYLYDNQSHPTAFYLSVLAQEEIGKFYILDDFVWHSRIDGRYSERQEKEILRLTFSHPRKQVNFILRSGFDVDRNFFGKKFIDNVFSRELEIKKQNSIYVGLPRRGRNIDMNGRINNPITISKNQSQKQITIVNNYFLDFISGVVGGFYTCDNEDLEEIISKELLLKLKSNWGFRSTKINKILLKREN